jgi:hypothetical protein
MVAFAEALAARFPPPLDTVFLVNTGSESVELAIRLAATATGHGGRASRSAARTTGGPSPPTPSRPPCSTTRWRSRRGRRGLTRSRHPTRCAGAIAGPDAGPATRTTSGGSSRTRGGRPRPAAFIAEALFGNAGGIVLPDGYLREAYAAVVRRRRLAIADEVQVGYGRLGAYRWAFEQQGVRAGHRDRGQGRGQRHGRSGP